MKTATRPEQARTAAPPEGMVIVDLRRSYTVAGKPYGPGLNQTVPKSLADSLGLAPKSQEAIDEADQAKAESDEAAGRAVAQGKQAQQNAQEARASNQAAAPHQTQQQQGLKEPERIQTPPSNILGDEEGMPESPPDPSIEESERQQKAAREAEGSKRGRGKGGRSRKRS